MKGSRQTLLERNLFEKRAWDAHKVLIGIDEVGRGCLAGPVAAAAVIVPAYTEHKLLVDSKTITENQRQKAFDWIKHNAFYGWAAVDHRYIDSTSIVEATKRAMVRSVYQLLLRWRDIETVSGVVVDAVHPVIPCFDGRVVSFCHGEDLSISIAAASIVAKVHRDALMSGLAQSFPYYALDKHKGYSTEQHCKAIRKDGMSIVHRKTFAHTGWR